MVSTSKQLNWNDWYPLWNSLSSILAVCLSHDCPHLTHLLSTLSLVILIDGLQAPNISGKDDLHHQIGHQSYESKNELAFLLCISKMISLIFWANTYMLTHSLVSIFLSSTNMSSRLWKSLSKRWGKLSKFSHPGASPQQIWIYSNLFSSPAFSSVSLSTR